MGVEKGIFADIAIIKEWKGDAEGNLVYRHTARNFNPMMATAAKLVVASSTPCNASFIIVFMSSSNTESLAFGVGPMSQNGPNLI